MYSLIIPAKISMIILLGVIILNIAEATKARIEELCTQRNINFCHLATISGIPYTTIKSIIYGQSKNPGITTIKKICDGLEISVIDFFNAEVFKNLEQEIK
jgi:transcriptional regulator with XRE-family HTH domain